MAAFCELATSLQAPILGIGPRSADRTRSRRQADIRVARPWLLEPQPQPILVAAGDQRETRSGADGRISVGWKPFNWIVAPANSIKGVLEPAGIENAKGLVTTLAYKSATDPRWQADADVKEFRQFLTDWMPQADIADSNLVTGYVAAFMTVKVLEMAR
jgi:hypothetical protein